MAYKNIFFSFLNTDSILDKRKEIISDENYFRGLRSAKNCKIDIYGNIVPSSKFKRASTSSPVEVKSEFYRLNIDKTAENSLKASRRFTFKGTDFLLTHSSLYTQNSEGVWQEVLTLLPKINPSSEGNFTKLFKERNYTGTGSPARGEVNYRNGLSLNTFFYCPVNDLVDRLPSESLVYVNNSSCHLANLADDDLYSTEEYNVDNISSDISLFDDRIRRLILSNSTSIFNVSNILIKEDYVYLYNNRGWPFKLMEVPNNSKRDFAAFINPARNPTTNKDFLITSYTVRDFSCKVFSIRLTRAGFTPRPRPGDTGRTFDFYVFDFLSYEDSDRTLAWGDYGEKNEAGDVLCEVRTTKEDKKFYSTGSGVPSILNRVSEAVTGSLTPYNREDRLPNDSSEPFYGVTLDSDYSTQVIGDFKYKTKEVMPAFLISTIDSGVFNIPQEVKEKLVSELHLAPSVSGVPDKRGAIRLATSFAAFDILYGVSNAGYVKSGDWTGLSDGRYLRDMYSRDIQLTEHNKHDNTYSRLVDVLPILPGVFDTNPDTDSTIPGRSGKSPLPFRVNPIGSGEGFSRDNPPVYRFCTTFNNIRDFDSPGPRGSRARGNPFSTTVVGTSPIYYNSGMLNLININEFRGLAAPPLLKGGINSPRKSFVKEGESPGLTPVYDNIVSTRYSTSEKIVEEIGDNSLFGYSFDSNRTRPYATYLGVYRLPYYVVNNYKPIKEFIEYKGRLVHIDDNNIYISQTNKYHYFSSYFELLGSYDYSSFPFYQINGESSNSQLLATDPIRFRIAEGVTINSLSSAGNILFIATDDGLYTLSGANPRGAETANFPSNDISIFRATDAPCLASATVDNNVILLNSDGSLYFVRDSEESKRFLFKRLFDSFIDDPVKIISGSPYDFYILAKNKVYYFFFRDERAYGFLSEIEIEGYNPTEDGDLTNIFYDKSTNEISITSEVVTNADFSSYRRLDEINFKAATFKLSPPGANEPYSVILKNPIKGSNSVTSRNIVSQSSSIKEDVKIDKVEVWGSGLNPESQGSLTIEYINKDSSGSRKESRQFNFAGRFNVGSGPQGLDRVIFENIGINGYDFNIEYKDQGKSGSYINYIILHIGE